VEREAVTPVTITIHVNPTDTPEKFASDLDKHIEGLKRMATLYTPCDEIEIETASLARLAFEYRNCHDTETLNALLAEFERRDAMQDDGECGPGSLDGMQTETFIH
jgi:hypothetical protein